MLETLGRGGMGVVYRAFDRERGVEVALKTLRGITPESVLRFKSEFRALRDVRHPNLVELGELFENDGVWFFTMELVRGAKFLAWVRAEADAHDARTTVATDSPTDLLADATAVDTPPFAPERRMPAREARAHRLAAPRCDVARLRTALAGLARGLGALHAAGKVHRDVKPSNILVEESGRVVLLDFGVVAELSRADQERMLFGTARYMAPEQARGGAIGPAADWYAVGVLLYQALTGQVPFAELSAEHLLELKQHASPPSPSDLVANVPPDLDALACNLLERDPQRRFGEAEIAELLGEEPPPPPAESERIFVGRRAELALLDAALATRTPVVIEGESGIGKSTLVERFAQEARAAHRGLLVLRGRCHERERVPFNALDGVIDDLARYLATRGDASLAKLVPDDVGALVAVFPALRVAFDGVVSGADVRGRGFRALRELFARLGRRRPVMIAIDDLQWADGDSAALLDELAGGPDAPPICIVATQRPTAEQLLRSAQRIELGGLSRPDAEALIRSVATADADVGAIVAETGGHPLFVRELARRHAGGPLRLDDVIRDRATRLGPLPQRVLAAVATAGAPIAQQIIASALGLAPVDAEPHVGALAREQLVRVYGPRPQDAIEPFHDRIRSAITGALTAEQQRSLQLALAVALEAAGAPPDALFVRFEAAGDRERAMKYLVEAAHAARAAFAFGRAAELFRRALEADALPDDRRRELLVELADALANSGRTSDAAGRYLEAAQLAPPDSEQRLDLLRRAAERFLMGGRVEQGLTTARALLDRVELAFPRTRARTIGGILWNQLRMRGRALAWHTPRPPRPRSLHADICWSMGAGLGMVDSLLGAYFSGRAARLALATGTPLQIARGMTAAMIGAALLGRRTRAATLLDAAARAAAEDGTSLSAWYVGLARTGFSFLIENDFHHAYDRARTLEAEWYAAGHGPAWETDVAIHFALASQQFTGRFADLARRARTLIHDAKLRGDLFQEITLRVRFAVRHLLADDPTTARADVLDALAAWMSPTDDSFGNQRMWALWSRTRIALYAGALDPALDDEWRKLHRSLIGRVPLMRVEGDHAYGTHLLARALDARRRNEHSTCAALLRQVERVTARMTRLPFPAVAMPVALLRAGVAWARHSSPSDATVVSLLRDAVDQARATKTVPYLPFTQRRLGEAIGGDEGAALIAAADADARAAGFTNPARAAELALPTGALA